MNHFLRSSHNSFLSTISDISEFTHDLHSGLCSLASYGFVETVNQLVVELGLFPNSVYLWQSYRSLRLLYLLTSSRSHDSLKLGDALAVDLASFVIKSTLQSIFNEDSPLYDAQHASRIMKEIESYSHAFSRSASSNVCLLLKLAKFYNKLSADCHKYAFHCMCGQGKVGLISYFLMCLNSSYHSRLFRHWNSHHQSPLYYAACGGHLEVVELLLDKGCECYYLGENPPLKGALVYLVSSRPLAYKKVLKPRSSQSRFRRQLSTNVGNSRSPADYSCYQSCSTWQSKVSAKHLIDLLLPSTEDLQQLLANDVHSSDIISLIAIQTNLHIIHGLLQILLDIFERLNLNLLTLSEHFFDDIVDLVPYHCDYNESFILLDDILAILVTHFVPHLSAVTTAARKGLWQLVKQALQYPLDEYGGSRAFLSMLSDIVLAGARCGRFDIVATVYNNYLHGNKVPPKCYRPILQAFEYGQLEISDFAQPDSGRNFLLEAMKLNVASVLEPLFNFFSCNDPSAVRDFDSLIKCCCSTSCLAILQKYFMDFSVTEDRDQEFWFRVLLFQSLKGNTQLALKAITSLSDAQLRGISEYPEFGTVLGNCCYWGMKDVLECLPFETLHLLKPCSYSELLSPWEIAIAMGHVGPLSWVQNFPRLSQALRSIPPDSQVHICVLGDDYHFDEAHLSCIAPLLFLGVSHKLLSSPDDYNECTALSDGYLPFRDKSAKSFLDLFDCAIKLGKVHFVKTCLKHIGTYAQEFLNEMLSFVYHACERKNNLEILELFLRHLHTIDGLNPQLGKPHERSLLALVVRLGSVPSAKVLVKWLPHDLLIDHLYYHYQLGNAPESNTLLHLAVLSKSTEMVDYVLELLGQDAPRFCCDKNSSGHSPLSLAFDLGLTHIICYSSLITETSLFVADSEKPTSLWEDLPTKCGWFHLLMQLNTLAISANNTNIQSTETSLNSPCVPPSDFRLPCIARLFRDAARKNKDLVVSRLLLLVDKFGLAQKIFLEFDNEVLGILVAGGYLSDVSLDFPQKSLQKIVTNSGREDLLLSLLKVDCLVYAGLLKQTFLFGCELNKSAIIHYILHESGAHLLFEDTNIIQEGLAHAIACGSFETASIICLECGIQLEHKYLPAGVQLSEVAEMMFTCSSYYQVLDRFYFSIAKPKSGQIPISVAWLVHAWTEKEAELIVRHLGSGNPLNPWSLHLQSQAGSQELTLSVDWESFTECLIHLRQEKDRYSHTPLLVEATVFSPAVLGQICQARSTSQCFDIFSFPTAVFLSSLILSSVTWPQKPSFSTLCEGQGVLTLSYIPVDGVFLFPSPTSPDLYDSTEYSDSDSVHLTAATDSHHLTDLFDDLANFSVTTIEKDMRQNLHASVSFSDEIVDISDIHLFTQRYETVKVMLNDIIQVLKLVEDHNVGVPFFCGYWSSNSIHQNQAPYSSKLRLPFTEAKIQFDLSDKYMSYSLQRDLLSVSIADHMLYIQLILPRESESVLGDVCFGLHDQLLDTLFSQVVTTHVQTAREKLENSTNTIVMSNLKNNLKLSGFLGSDFISLLYEDSSGQKLKLFEIDPQQSVYIGLFKELKTFLVLFSKLLWILSYQPRLQANVRRVYETGFKVILSEKQNTSFSLKGSIPYLVVNAQQLVDGIPRRAIVEALDSLLRSAQGKKSLTLDRSIPSPIMSYVDFQKSTGLLYPIINKTGKITIQLIDHKSEIISSIPSVSCVLDVYISIPGGSKLKASSSPGSSFSEAGKHLSVSSTPSGQFVVEWTPMKAGIHYIRILLNGVPVKGSPFKTHTLNAKDVRDRQASVRESITFIVSHNLSFNLSSQNHWCSGFIPPVVLHKHRSIRELIAAAVSGGKPSAPLPPSRDSSRSKTFQNVSCDGYSAVHHISMCSMYGGASQWFHLPIGNVVVHILPHASFQRQLSQAKSKRKLSRNNFNITHYSMSSGFTRVAITCRYAGEYKLFVSCSKCQSVMDVLWLDSRTSLPSLLHITPHPC